MEKQENLKILVAEDNRINQRLINLTFGQIGMSCDIASDGVQALEMYKRMPYDLIFMDMHMPVMDGLETSRLIREFEREVKIRKPVTIIALTASERSQMKDECLDAGMDDFVEKPINGKMLLQVINKFKH